ncbi:hypothetical protein HGA91_05665 [candidate division WWE3 bacterium]|nr:hypothetical protein [candidate division WWE3 bacterium]
MLRGIDFWCLVCGVGAVLLLGWYFMFYQGESKPDSASQTEEPLRSSLVWYDCSTCGEESYMWFGPSTYLQDGEPISVENCKHWSCPNCGTVDEYGNRSPYLPPH